MLLIVAIIVLSRLHRLQSSSADQQDDLNKIDDFGSFLRG
jgi:hypothetical protein